MGWRQWSAVAVVIGGGILLQIPGHDAEMASMGHIEMPAEIGDARGPYHTVALEVTGMT